MTHRIEFIVEGKPVPNNTKQGKYGAYKPPEVIAYRKLIQEQVCLIRQKHPFLPYKDSVAMTLCIFMCIPKSWSKNRKDKAMGSPVKKRPDTDNIHKLVKDTISNSRWNSRWNNNIYLIEDDCLVGDDHIYKRYSNRGYIKIILTDELQVLEELTDEDNG
jgi:Holliday junction resolvase RusA-like endonuclease